MHPDQLNYHHLRLFRAVVREGGVTRAARVLHLAQPTVSAQVRALEDAVGVPLFERSGRSLVLTETGRTVYRYAEEIFAIGRDLAADLAGGGGGRAPRRVGVSGALPRLTTVRLLAPGLHLDDATAPPFVCRVGKTERLAAELAAHDLDLVLADAPVAPALRLPTTSLLLGASAVTVFGAPALVAKVRREFPASLDGQPFLLPAPDSALRRSLDAFFAARGIRPDVRAEIEDLGLLQAFGRLGVGLFAAPSVVEREIRLSYDVGAAGVLPGVKERFYAVTAARRTAAPAVEAIISSARAALRTKRRA